MGPSLEGEGDAVLYLRVLAAAKGFQWGPLSKERETATLPGG